MPFPGFEMPPKEMSKFDSSLYHPLACTMKLCTIIIPFRGKLGCLSIQSKSNICGQGKGLPFST
jgi:hypothetical protein